MSVILDAHFLSFYYFAWQSGLVFGVLEIPLQEIASEPDVSDSFSWRETWRTFLCKYRGLSTMH